MNNPKISAVLSALATVYFGYAIFGANEQPSPMLSFINWLFFIIGLIGFAGSLAQIAKGD